MDLMSKVLLLSALTLPISGVSTVQPCSFPKRCDCTLEKAGVMLICYAMEQCFNQAGMDAIARGVRRDVCPVQMFLTRCSPTSKGHPWPQVEPKSRYFSHRNWRHLRLVEFGSRCWYRFNERQLLHWLPGLRRINVFDSRIEAQLSRFSSIFCCPSNIDRVTLRALTLMNNTTGSLIQRKSFINYRVVSQITIIDSSSIQSHADLLLNTSARSFVLLYKQCLPTYTTHFSNISISNLRNGSDLTLQITRVAKVSLSLDAPASIDGFRLVSLAITRTRISYVGASPLQDFRLNDLTFVDAWLSGSMMLRILNSLQAGQSSLPLIALAIEFKQSKPTFPFDELNAICRLAPRLYRIALSYSTISLTDPPGQYLECPQLRVLSLTNNKLRNSDIPPDAFHRMPNLTNVRLEGNLFDRFPTELFQNISNSITYLSISGNKFMTFEPTVLRGILPNLETLEMAHIGINKPLTDAFVDQYRLKNLVLNAVRLLATIDCPFKETWFRNLSALTYLEFASNSFFGSNRCTTIGFFDPLTRLKKLILTFSATGHQQPEGLRQLIRRLSSLQSLVIDGNSLGSLESFLTVKMPHLTYLNVANNSIAEIPEDLLHNMVPDLRMLDISGSQLLRASPLTFSRLPNLRINLGTGRFACDCELLPFADWLREQWPIYEVKTMKEYLAKAECHTMPNGSAPQHEVMLIDFRMSWWDCYDRRLIALLSSSIAALLIIFATVATLTKYRWKIQYNWLSFCIRHELVKRKTAGEWAYDACFIYDETDAEVSYWVSALVHKLESDLQLRLYEPERDAPAGSNILDEAASAIDRSRHAVLVLSRGFLQNRLNLYSAQWSNESLFLRGRSLAVLVMRERLDESELRAADCKVLHRLYRMCRPDRIIDCSGCSVGGNSANRLGLLLYRRSSNAQARGSALDDTRPLLQDG